MLKVLGVDHGNVRIGIAISDESGSLARPLTIISHVSRMKDAESVQLMAEEQGCGRIVVGIPYDLDGSEGPRARSVLRFVDQLKNLCQIPVTTWDESFSTQKTIETSILLGKKRSSRQLPSDDKAAAMILQSYLDYQAETAKD